MGTRWRGVLAPINQPTGDGRRMATGAFTHRPLPLPLRWQRQETDGHNEAVTIGVIDTLHIDNEAGHVWGEGELFDDVSPATNPRLAEDVREAMFLTEKGTIGPSVDPGHAAAVAVHAGTDSPVGEQSMFEAMVKGGKPPKTEMLFTAYEIAGATLVPVPAFGQCRPLELGGLAPASLVASEFVDSRAAILAAAALDIDPALFADPGLDRITPITRRDLGNGLVHVFGHIAEHLTCLVGRRDMCITPPYSGSEYSQFHRYHETADGELRFPLPVGRLTAGFGSLENTCRCCPGNDDHACANLTFGQAVAHHDRMQVLAYVRAGEDETNNAIWVSGIEAPGIDEQGRALLSRQKVSGDWRENRGGMELTEVLVLNRRSPGFPLPRTSASGGRQRALTAAGAILSPLDRQELLVGLGLPLDPAVDAFNRADPAGWGGAGIDYDRLAAGVAQALMAAAEPQAAPGPQEQAPEELFDGFGLAVTAAAKHTGAMVALVPTAEHAARLAVTGGEPIEDLHMTIAYLGEADDVPPEARQRIHDHAAKLAAGQGGPIEVNASDLTYFNPGNTNGFDTALVLGLSGEGLTELHDGFRGLDLGGWEMPKQHVPYKPHVTLQYTNDMGRAGALTDRVGPLQFDRLRLAYGGEFTDIPLGTPPGGPITEVGGGYDIAGQESMMSHGLRARAALASLELAGVDGVMGFNKNQRRGPDGKWIKMGGPGSAGGRGGLPGRREGAPRTREGGGAGAGGGSDSGREAADVSRDLREIADQVPNPAIADNIRRAADNLDAAAGGDDPDRLRGQLVSARAMLETQRNLQARAGQPAPQPRRGTSEQIRHDAAVDMADEMLDDPLVADSDKDALREQVRRVQQASAGERDGEVSALEELMELIDTDEDDED